MDCILIVSGDWNFINNLLFLLDDLYIISHPTEEDTTLLTKILTFATALAEIPATGFQVQPSIAFRHARDLDDHDPTKLFPKGDTCTLCLSLPVPVDYDTLKTHLTNVVEICDGFLLEWFPYSFSVESYAKMFITFMYSIHVGGQSTNALYQVSW